MNDTYPTIERTVSSTVMTVKPAFCFQNLTFEPALAIYAAPSSAEFQASILASPALPGIGISFNETNGEFDVDSDKLKDALRSNPDGVRNLFINSGTSSEPGIEFVGLNKATDTSNPFTIDITQVATKAGLTGSGPLAGTTTITTGVNDQLDLSINNQSFSLTLAAGDYTQAALVDHLNELASEGLDGSSNKLAFSVDGSDVLSVETTLYGSNSTLTFDPSSALSALNMSNGSSTGKMSPAPSTALKRPVRAKSCVELMAKRVKVSVLVTSENTLSGAEISTFRGLGQKIHDALNTAHRLS